MLGIIIPGPATADLEDCVGRHPGRSRQAVGYLDPKAQVCSEQILVFGNEDE